MLLTLRKTIGNLWTQWRGGKMANGLYANIHAKRKALALKKWKC